MTHQNPPVVALADYLDKRARQIESVRMPPEWFSVLTQVRRTNEIDEDFALGIHTFGQMNNGLAAVLSSTEAVRYVEEINQMWGTRHTLADLTLIIFEGKPSYLVIFAGHRRHAHVQHANACVAEGRYPPADPSKFDSFYGADLYFDITAEEAIEMQFNENHYLAPPLHEEAEAAWRLWRYKLKKNPHLTISAFGKSIGHSAEWVKNALRFCNLPPWFQSCVTGDNELKLTLPYGTLVALARLAESYKAITGQEMGERAMQTWLVDAFANKLSTSAFNQRVSGYLEEKRLQAAGQISLFGSDAEPTAVDRDRHARRVVGTEMIRFLMLAISYASTVQKLQQGGLLGGDTYLGPHLTLDERERYSPGSPVRLWVRFLDLVNGLTPELAQISRSERMGQVRRLLRGHPIAEQALVALAGFAAAEEEAAAGAPH